MLWTQRIELSRPSLSVLWNERLLIVRELETKLQEVYTQRLPPLSEEERAQLLVLGSDLERAWNHPAATAETRKRILRTVITEIVARIEGNEVHLGAPLARRRPLRAQGSQTAER
jgi:hypothetical protein